MIVPYLDLAAAQAELRPGLDAAYARVMDSGWYVLGPEVEAFERAFAAACGAAHAVGVGSGLDAIELGLRAAGIGPGDEVIVPAHTYVATWLGVSRTGASVVPVDADPRTLLIDVDAVRAAIGPRTAAIVPVHLYGLAADMTALGDLAGAHGLAVVDDAAQAHGAVHRGTPVGALGTATAFSFYPGKNLGALGDGGAVTSADAALTARIRRLRNYGSDEKYVHREAAGNSRLDELQAAFLQVKLAHLDGWNARRAAVAARYLEQLAAVAGLVLPAAGDAGDVHAWHVFCVRHPERDALAAHLAGRGVGTLMHYPIPPHRSEAFAGLGHPPGSFPVSEAAAASLLSLPIGPHMAPGAVDEVVDAVRSFAG